MTCENTTAIDGLTLRGGRLNPGTLGGVPSAARRRSSHHLDSEGAEFSGDFRWSKGRVPRPYKAEVGGSKPPAPTTSFPQVTAGCQLSALRVSWRAV